MATTPQPKLVSAESLATQLGVSEQTVYRWIERGDLAAEKHGRTYMIDRKDAEQLWLRAAEKQSAAPERAESEAAAKRERELAELRGRYLELQERVIRLEQELDGERRRSIRLELELEETAATPARRVA
jgi:excisionase family DNA binding protein